MKPRFRPPSIAIAAAIVLLALAHVFTIGTLLHRFRTAVLAVGTVAVLGIVLHLVFARWILGRRDRTSS